MVKELAKQSGLKILESERRARNRSEGSVIVRRVDGGGGESRRRARFHQNKIMHLRYLTVGESLSILLLKSNSSTHYSKALYDWGVRRRGKTGKHGNVEAKRKWWVLAQTPYSQQGKWRKSPSVDPMGIDHPTRRIIKGAGKIKGWEDQLDRGRIPDIRVSP